MINAHLRKIARLVYITQLRNLLQVSFFLWRKPVLFAHILRTSIYKSNFLNFTPFCNVYSYNGK